MTHARSVVVVGASGSGKTTLVSGLRTPAYRSRVVVPRRFVTRLERLDDEPNENVHLSHADFQSLVEAGEIYPHWHRTLERCTRERGGFATVDDMDRRLRVYPANNSFLRDGNSSVLDVLETAIVVIVMTRRATRDARLSRKDMPAAERAIRLADGGEDVITAGLPARLIDTTDLTPEEGQRALRVIVDELFSS